MRFIISFGNIKYTLRIQQAKLAAALQIAALPHKKHLHLHAKYGGAFIEKTNAQIHSDYAKVSNIDGIMLYGLLLLRNSAAASIYLKDGRSR